MLGQVTVLIFDRRWPSCSRRVVTVPPVIPQPAHSLRMLSTARVPLNLLSRTHASPIHHLRVQWPTYYDDAIASFARLSATEDAYAASSARPSVTSPRRPTCHGHSICRYAQPRSSPHTSALCVAMHARSASLDHASVMPSLCTKRLYLLKTVLYTCYILVFTYLHLLLMPMLELAG